MIDPRSPSSSQIHHAMKSETCIRQ